MHGLLYNAVLYILTFKDIKMQLVNGSVCTLALIGTTLSFMAFLKIKKVFELFLPFLVQPEFS